MFEKLLAKLNTSHLFIGISVFVTGTLLHYFNHLTGEYVAFASTVLTYLGAHLYLKNGNDPDTPNPPGFSAN